MAHGFKVIALKDVEHLDHVDTTRRWRRHGGDGVTPEGAGYRRALDNLVSREVLKGDQAAILCHVRGKFLGHAACVKCLAIGSSDFLQAPGQVFLIDALANPIGRAVRFEEYLRGFGSPFSRPRPKVVTAR